ncbi:hypothetical protein PFLUV_G00092760 [Perca fluviatilis]|uniref:Uncharacterized protein n=1 Tax=Perca fluviatilis TaxID=8168 RepID=A0A6A5F5F7_PERFL|nr:hypothetical protein PFLUV_G00092760 [Perca fluviatilis]
MQHLYTQTTLHLQLRWKVPGIHPHRRAPAETELNEEAHLFPDYSAPVAEMEGQDTRPLPPAPDNAGREEDMETETSGDDGAPMGNADEQQKCTMCSLRLKEIIRLQEENRN